MANETWWSYYDNMNNTGGGGGGVTVLTEDENGALNKTWAEIKESPFVVLKLEDGDITTWSMVYGVEQAVGVYSVSTDSYTYTTDSPDGYPARGDSPE